MMIQKACKILPFECYGKAGGAIPALSQIRQGKPSKGGQSC